MRRFYGIAVGRREFHPMRIAEEVIVNRRVQRLRSVWKIQIAVNFRFVTMASVKKRLRWIRVSQVVIAHMVNFAI